MCKVLSAEYALNKETYDSKVHVFLMYTQAILFFLACQLSLTFTLHSYHLTQRLELYSNAMEINRVQLKVVLA